MKKRNALAGTHRIFWFTLRQTCSERAWLVTTLLITALLVVGIPLLLILSVTLEDDGDSAEDAQPIRQVIVCDETPGAADYSVLAQGETFTEVTYTAAATFTDAKKLLSEANADETLLLHITKAEDAFALTLCLPEETAITMEEAYAYADFVEGSFIAVLTQKAALNAEQLSAVMMPVITTATQTNSDGTPVEEPDFVTQMIEIFFPFLMIMLMYFMILFYGQSVANSVLLEKTSKLMDTMLTSVHPFALISGKLFGVAFAAFVQILIWLVSCVLGCMIGLLLALDMVPETTNTVVNTLNTLSEQDTLFTVRGIALTIIFIGLGFLLYCALSAISGALASKTEDLGKTNYIFVLALVISFFLCLGSPEMDEGMIATSPWLNYFPFTAILVVPGQLLLGKLSMGQAFLSMGIMIVGVILVILVAAVIYRLLVLYRGNPPSAKMLLSMLRGSRNTQNDSPAAKK